MNDEKKKPSVAGQGSRQPNIEHAHLIAGLRAQVDDLKYTLENVLQCLVANADMPRQQRYESLIADARAALKAKETDYLD